MSCNGLGLVTGLLFAVTLITPGCGDDAAQVRNSTPIIDSLTAYPDTVDAFTATRLTCWAHDPDGDDLLYTWSAFTGTITGSGPAIKWIAPRAVGTHWVFVTVEDARGASTSDTSRIVVLKPPDTLACAAYRRAMRITESVRPGGISD